MFWDIPRKTLTQRFLYVSCSCLAVGVESDVFKIGWINHFPTQIMGFPLTKTWRYEPERSGDLIKPQNMSIY